jgi:hypothetical protein
MDALIGIMLLVVLSGGAAILSIIMLNRSRWTLDQAVECSGHGRSELLDMIHSGWLRYERRYGLFGDYTIDESEIARAYADYQEAMRIQAETDALIRSKVEEMVATLGESVRNYQREQQKQQEELAAMQERYANILATMSQQLGLIPPVVVQAFRVLDIPEDAPLDTIHQRYRLLAKRFHPDKGGESQQFIQIHTAYTCLLAWKQSQVEK